MTLALYTQLDLLATTAPPLKHPIPTSVLSKGAQICKLGKQAALKPRACGGLLGGLEQPSGIHRDRLGHV